MSFDPTTRKMLVFRLLQILAVHSIVALGLAFLAGIAVAWHSWWAVVFLAVLGVNLVLSVPPLVTLAGAAARVDDKAPEDAPSDPAL